MVINDLKSALGQKRKDKSSTKEDEHDDEELYNLVRGNKSAMVIQRLDEGGEEFVPARKVNVSSKVIMAISADDSDDSGGNKSNKKKEAELQVGQAYRVNQ